MPCSNRLVVARGRGGGGGEGCEMGEGVKGTNSSNKINQSREGLIYLLDVMYSMMTIVQKTCLL